MTMPQQAIGRIQWGDLVFGPGTPYTVTALDGLDDLPEIRSEDMERPQQHGDYTGPDFTGPRTINLKLGIRGETPDHLRKLTLALQAATQPGVRPAQLQFLDQNRLVWAKVRRRAIPYDAEYLWRIGDATLQLYCADPYLYGLEEKAAWTAAYSPSAGRTYPLVYGGPVPLLRNRVLNPSAEVDLSNTQVYSGATRDRITSDARYGTASIRHVQQAGTTFGGTRYSIAPAAAGTTVTASVWVKTDGAGTTAFFAFRSASATLDVASAGTPTPGQWERVSVQYTVPAGQTCTEVAIAYNAPTGATWLADAMMVETGTVLHDYIDGDQPLCTWETVPHASPSRLHGTTGRSYGAQGTSGRVTALNEGAADAYPVLRLDGPIATPAIEQVTTGGILALDATVQANEYLIIDTRSRAVLLMGTSPRRTWVRAGSTWPVLKPGTNEIAYRGGALPGATDQSSLLTITWRDTSL
ncbi:phage distal tail protein [Streptomyces sp. NPDC096048]|uniref:phage head spike fiber domain-containing protein n=1 Tax=Streptomyces sp. NPDC096048 TaxID=3366072 RepID=UPI00380D798A